VEVLDSDGSCLVEQDDELLARLRSVRRGEESLWVHINGEAAFLCFFLSRDGGHLGFVPEGMWTGELREVRFLLVGGDTGGTSIGFNPEVVGALRCFAQQADVLVNGLYGFGAMVNLMANSFGGFNSAATRLAEALDRFPQTWPCRVSRGWRW
jgi:hypothetical protein